MKTWNIPILKGSIACSVIPNGTFLNLADFSGTEQEHSLVTLVMADDFLICLTRSSRIIRQNVQREIRLARYFQHKMTDEKLKSPSKNSTFVCQIVQRVTKCFREAWLDPWFLSPPVPTHGGLLCIAFCLSICPSVQVTRTKVTRKKSLEKNLYLSNRSN